ncbi:MAG: oligosaccharide flippase family protein [Thermoleophilaceae bacterium]
MSVPPTVAATAAPPPTDVLDTPAAGGLAIRGSAVRAAGQLTVMGLSLASLPLLTRHLGVAQFGRYALVVSLVGLVGTVTDSGLGALAVREYAVRSGADRDRLLANLLGVRLALTVVAVAIAVVYALLAGFGGPLVLGTVLAGIGLFFAVAQGALAVPLAAELRLGWVAVLDLMRQAVLVSLIVGLVLLGAGIVEFLAVPIASGLVALLGTARLVRGRTPFVPRLEPAQSRALLRETIPLAAAGLIYNVYFRLVLLVMGLVSTALQTGYFALSFRVVEVLMVVPFLLIGTLLPLLSRAARDDQVRLRYALARTWDVALIGAGCFALVTALGAPVAIAVIAPGSGAPAAGVLRIQALALAIAFLSITWGISFIALRWHRVLVLSNGFALLVTLALALALIPLLGARGAALATVIGELSLLVISCVAVVRRRRDLWPGLGVLPRVLAAVAVGAGVVLVPALGDVARTVAATTLYFVVLALLRAIPDELVAAVRGGRLWLPPRRRRLRRSGVAQRTSGRLGPRREGQARRGRRNS